MKTTDEYVYYENNWFPEMKRNNDNLMWRYWAAKEMANGISDYYALSNFPMNTEEYAYRLYQAISNGYPCPKIAYNYLVQLLKKEWFR